MAMKHEEAARLIKEYIRPENQSGKPTNAELAAMALAVKTLEERTPLQNDLERLLWLSGLCKYCAKSKGKGGHARLDRLCLSCEPVWRGINERR